MLKKLMILLFCLMLVMPTAVFAEEGDLPVLEKPAGLEVRHDEYGTIILRMTQLDSIMRYMDEDISLHYSEVATIGKGQGSAIPDSLEAPQNLAGELKKYENGQPYFHFTFNIPKSVEDTYKVTRVWTKLDWKIGNGKWATELAEVEPFEAADMLFTDNVDVDPIDEGSWDEIDIKENTYYFRAFFEMKKPDGSIVKSPFSNIVEMGSPAFYSGASDWAKPELQEAYDKGLIPDILKGADMTKPINREEFAELAVLLYEKATKKTASAAPPNPFTDTTNKQILKAYELGITKGTLKTTFSPKVLINREECATMLYRAIKAIVPDGDYSIAGVKDFPDQKYISSWAVEGTKYMFKLGIIKGDDRGYFMPKATTTAQEAAGYGMATREAAVLMTVRTSNKLSDLPAADTESTPGADASPASNLDSLISKAAGIDTGYFEALSEVSGHTTEIKYWKKGSMVKKVQTESSDNKTKIDIFDMSKGVAYSYFEGSSEAVKTVYAVSDPSKYINPFNIIESFTLGSVGESVETKITADETIDGVSCSVITTTVDGKTYAKIWVSEDGLKRRSETLYFGFPMTTLYKNYRIGGSISDSEFELPPGMTIDEGITVTITE
jgi:outer membrane lipoprotein-sorting protein